MSDWLVRWGEWLTGASPNIERRLVAATPLPAWLTLLLAIGGMTLVALVYTRETASRRRRMLLATLRIGVLALLLTMMQGWELRRHRTDRPDLVLAVDVSASMRRDEREPGDQPQRAEASRPTRLEQVQAALLRDGGEPLRSLSAGRRPHVVWLARSAQPAVQEPLVALREPPTPPADLADPAAAEWMASRLGDGLRDLLDRQRGRRTAAIILFTDGATTAGELLSEAAALSPVRDIPLFLVGVGDRRPPRDVALRDLLVDRTAYVGDLVTFELRLVASGYEGRTVRVRLTRDGQPEVLDEVEVALPATDPQTSAPTTATQPLAPPAVPVRLSYRVERPGSQTFRVEAPPLPGESRSDNNRLETTIEVRDATVKVLLVCERPSFDYQFLKNLLGRGLRRDLGAIAAASRLTAAESTPPADAEAGAVGAEQAFDLTAVLQDADPLHARQDAHVVREFPVGEEALFAYDVVVLGDADPARLSPSQQTDLARFVEERGGGLVLLSGPRHLPIEYLRTPLEPLFPVRLESVTAPPLGVPLRLPIRPRLTELGHSLPYLRLADTSAEEERLWSRMPPGYWLVRATELRPAARVVVEASDASGGEALGEAASGAAPAPWVVSQFYGAGQVVFHASDESYRWSAHPDGPRYYARYWLQTMRHLAQARVESRRSCELSSERTQYQSGEPVELRATFLDERLAPAADNGVALMVELRGGRRRELRLERIGERRGMFSGRLDDLAPGDYRAWLATPSLPQAPDTIEFSVQPARGELSRPEPDWEELSAAARQSGRPLYGLDELDQLWRELPGGVAARAEPLPPRPLWNSQPALALLVLLLAIEWIVRRRSGLA